MTIETALGLLLLLVGAPMVARTAVGIARGRLAADIVAALAIATAIVTGQAIAGLVIVVMQLGGEALERHAFRRASRSLAHLLARAPRVARRLEDGEPHDVPVQAVRVGDRLLVRPGDLVPVDAVVERGHSRVDASALTGEPEPQLAQAGVPLMSGSVNLDGALTVRATREAQHSQYQVIVQLVERARRERPPIQRMADRWAVWFTPLTLAMCGLAVLLGGGWDTVLAVLVVATPCPLILATPVAVLAGIGRAARAGIIVKTGGAIEALGKAAVIAFDKTGTLTLGRPTVADVVATDSVGPDELLRLAASVEQASSHHLGGAILAAARERDLRLLPLTAFEEVPGVGVRGVVDGRRVAVGSAEHAGATVSDAPGTTAWVAVDDRPVGRIQFADRVRDNAAALVRRLRAAPVEHVVMLTGDRPEQAARVAAAVGIDDVRAGLTPAAKVAAVQDLRRRYRDGVVAMVGDGINDAPALAAAEVGVAMGAHAPAASAEAADIVLLVDDVGRVADAVAIGRRTRAIALQSIGVGLGVSGLHMVIAALGYIPPTAGALCQEALDIGVIVNALRAGGAGSAHRV